MEAMDMENSHNRGGGSSETRETSFDVYLSFRGPDTRHGFVDHLYRSLHQEGIRVFTDEGCLTLGESIGQSLFKAIRHSKIAILILSKNYASSKWCLRELAQIVECHKTMGLLIMPVFLGVTRSVVRHRSHVYAGAIAEHRWRRENPNTLREWEEALIRVGSIQGLESAGLGTHTSIIDALVADVRVLNRYSVGIEHRVERFSARNCLSLIQLPESISRGIEAESSSKVEYSKPANTEHSSSQGVKRKFEGNEGRIVNISSDDDELMKLNSLPNGGIGWRKIGKIFVSRNEIARGSSGTIVFEGMYEYRHVAVKRLNRPHHDEFATNEIQILITSDRHENIVRYYGVEYEQDFVYLALERCTCSLDDLIQVHLDSSNNHDPTSMDNYKIKLDSVRAMMQDVDLWWADGYPSPLLLKLMRDVVSGLRHLHDLGIIHRDLKPQNVLITKNQLVGAQLCDMGISRCLPEDRSSLGYHATGCGTSGWQAPEQLLSGGRQTRQMDLFSLGCVLFFCVTRGRHPFGEILERDFNIAYKEMNLSLVEFIPEAHDLFSRLLNRDPKLRPTASEVLRHPFFWSSAERLSFLGDVSDKVESEAKAPNSDLLDALESTAQLVFDENWDDKIEHEVMADLRKRRKYEGTRVKDLLRAVRNKCSHYTETPKEVKKILGPERDDLDAYFARRFPRLLIESYRVVCQICKGEKCFQKYSLFPPWPLPTEIPSSSQQGRP